MIMQLKICLEEVDKIGLKQKIAEGNYRRLQIKTKSQIKEISTLLLPIIDILKQYPLIKIDLIPENINQPQFDVVALGGTFDYLHIGHQLLLLTAIQLAKKQIIVGITGQQMLMNKKNRQLIEPISERTRRVEQYVKKIKPGLIFTSEQLKDPFGPAITREDIDAIVVSSETMKGGQKINEIRKEKGFHGLQICACCMVSPVSEQNITDKISSSQIRSHFLTKNYMSTDQITEYRLLWDGLQQKILAYLDYSQIAQYNHIKDKWFRIVLTQYSEYWRYYHVNYHIYDMLKQFYAEWSTSQKLTDLQKLVIQISIWFHDVQYNTKNNDNQQKSAETAQIFLTDFNILSKDQLMQDKLSKLISSVKCSILSTKNHTTENYIQKILIDIDMSILNSDMLRYLKYSDQIRQQYWPVVKEKFAEKRLQFLKKLDLSTVFFLVENPVNLKSNVEQQIINLSNQIGKQ